MNFKLKKKLRYATKSYHLGYTCYLQGKGLGESYGTPITQSAVCMLDRPVCFAKEGSEAERRPM